MLSNLVRTVRNPAPHPPILDFCTYFDRNYLPLGLALYRSLARKAGTFRLWVLCLDPWTREFLDGLKLPGLQTMGLDDLEREDPALAAAKSTRSKVEYFFTAGPAFIQHLLNRRPEIEVLCYLDSDIEILANPQAILDELGGGSVLIVPHDLSSQVRGRLRKTRKYGKFNVGVVAFRRDHVGLECSASWRAQCIEWCYDRVEPGRYADQKYLEAWPSKWGGVVVSSHPGINLAPWSAGNRRIQASPAGALVDGRPVVAFHFHALRRVERGVYDLGLQAYGAHGNTGLVDELYRPRMARLEAIYGELETGGRWQQAGQGARLEGRGRLWRLLKAGQRFARSIRAGATGGRLRVDVGPVGKSADRQRPRATIVIPVLNEPQVGAAIASVRSQQDVPAPELIVVDGGSSGATALALERNRAKIDRFVSERDDGIYDAMNKGLRLATGDFVLFLGANDCLHDARVLADVTSQFEAGADCCVGDVFYTMADHRVVRHWRVGAFRRWRLRFGWMPPHPGFFARRGLLIQEGGFHADLRIAADYDLMLRVLLRPGIRVKSVPRVVARLTPGGVSGRLPNIPKANLEVRRSLRRNGRPISALFVPILKPLQKLPQFIVRRRRLAPPPG